MPAVGLSTKEVVCVYGMPSEAFLRTLLGWLEEGEGRYLAVLEDGPGQVALPHKRMHLIDVSDTEAIKKLAWEFVFLSYDYLEETEKDPQKREEAFQKFRYFQEGIELVASDYGERGLDLLQNFLKNSALFKEAREGKALFGAFKQIPAIICGAGPSLEKEIPYLRSLEDRALLFAGGTTLSSLAGYSLRPHFGGVIDPHPPEERLLFQQAHEVPIFFQTRAHPKLLKAVQGPYLKIPGGGNDFFEEESFDAGWNVTTFLVALATHLGCNPIILTGVDLSQRGEHCYAAGLNRSEGGELVEVGEGLFTRKDWLYAADWLKNFAKKHPEVEWINASDGLEIPGMENKNLTDISFEKQEDLSSKIHSQIHGLQKGVFQGFDEGLLRGSFANVSKHIEQMLILLEKIFPDPPERSGEVILLELELEKEVAYTQFLQRIWDRWKYVFMRQIGEEIPKEYGIMLNRLLFMKGICDDARNL